MAAESIGAFGSLLGGLSSIGSGILGLVMSGRQSQQSHMEQRQWERSREPAGELFKSLFYAPQLETQAVPFGTWTAKEAYKWSPNQAMNAIYSSYLNRTYGLPESVARAQVAQALQPVRMPQIAEALYRPQDVSASVTGQQDPQVLAQALLQSKTPEISRQLDYLKNAAELSALNLWRAQQLPLLIG